MKFSHVFISRPRREAEELAAMLVPLGLGAIVQPAFDYVPLDTREEDPEAWSQLESAGAGDLMIFTSPRAVQHGLAQLPREAVLRLRLAAIGPATASALAAAGLQVDILPDEGFTSEALLATLAGETGGLARGQLQAFIVAAPGGRRALVEGLTDQGWQAKMLMVYRSEPAELDTSALELMDEAAGLVVVWTSSNAMNALSQRLPSATWLRLCQGDWLVISHRLENLARAYGPTRIHLADGPGNGAILESIRSLLSAD